MRAAIALGSNLPSRFGDPPANLREALRRLQDLGQVTAVSSFHQTDPVGYTDQPRFINAAAVLETIRAPLDLLQDLLAIEQAMGRLRAADAPLKGPRVIDLDLLLYEDGNGRSLTMQHADLILPHPALHERRFVLAPLAEIAPGILVPPLGQTVRQLAEALAAAETLALPDR